MLFWKDVVKHMNVSDKHSLKTNNPRRNFQDPLQIKPILTSTTFGRIQIGTLCYQKKLHDVLFDDEIEVWVDGSLELMFVRITLIVNPKDKYPDKTSFFRARQS